MNKILKKEFKWTLFKSLFAIASCMILFFFIYNVLDKTFTGLAVNLATNADWLQIQNGFMEPMIIPLMALIMILTIALPALLYFLAPGVYSHKWRIIIPLMLMSIGCFFVGASIAYYVVTPLLLNFYKGFIPRSIAPMITIGNLIEILLIFTILFQLFLLLPLFSFMSAKINIKYQTWMVKYRKYAVIVIFVLGALLTPPDPISMIIIALPLILMYEVSIRVARFAGKNTLI